MIGLVRPFHRHADVAARLAQAGPVLYVFDDPALEARDGVDEHLFRIGPRNARIVKAKAAALQQALGLPAPAGR